jgi:membrane protein YqaA with SNARE-associated domain
VALRLLLREAVRSLTTWVLATFTSPLGVFVLAALDSTLFFSMPFGIDAAVIILAARSRALAWIVALLATGGGVAGAALTFWMGAKIGEAGLERYIPARRLQRVRNQIKSKGAIALAAVDLIPPPFPFTPVVLAAGALDVSPTVFFATLTLTRLIRFGAESALAIRFGKRILSWLESDVVQDVIAGLILIAIVLTVYAVVRLIRSSRTTSRRAAA